MKRIIFVFLFCSFLVFVASCEKTLPTLSVEEAEINLYVDDSYKIKVEVTELESFKLDYVIDNPEVIEVVDGSVKALREGDANITVSLNGYEDVPSIKVKVVVTTKPSIKITGESSVEVGEEITLTATLIGLEGDVLWSTNDNGIATVDNGKVKGKSAGDVVITATCGEYSANFEVNVIFIPDTEAPEFILGENYKEMIRLNWNKSFDPLEGITAIDNKDGDLTSEIQVVSNIDNKEYGVQTVELSVTDKAGNTKTMTRTVEVVWDYAVEFIGHAGSYYGLMNSEEAILYAIQVLKYQAVEIDLKQTADGVFILCHDDTFGGYALASTNWDVLKDVTVTSSRNAGIPSQNGSVTKSPYTAKLCTLERYLEICKEYNVKAVIELKSSIGITNSDQSRMKALMDVIEAKDMKENVIFLGSQYNCLIWTRNNGYADIPCQYLVNSFESDTYLQRCKDYNLDISINVTGSYSNSDEWLAKYKEAGIKVSTYTYTQYVDYPVVQQWIDKGVDYVTCDWHLMSKLRLPEKSNEEVKTYEVLFKDYDGKVLKKAIVKEGGTAAGPTMQERKGYTFTGWSKDITNVRENFEVVAQYEVNTYTINYNPNVTEIVESSWESKAKFIEEFYGDLYNWLLTNGKNVSEITVSGNKVTMTKHGVTVTFNNVEELKAMDKYNFELTISNIICKPVVRATDGSAVIEESEDYFLNSTAYREKYLALDAWFANCIAKDYPTYDNTYKPLSNGKIQIMFRFHQWQQGTSIKSFNTLPKKYLVTENPNIEYTLPTMHLTYTVEDEFDLPVSTGNQEFLGWFLDKECTKPITKIEKGSTGSIVVYASWKEN